MATKAKREARLNFRLSADHKALIEKAAVSLGQSVSDFAIATLVQTSRSVLDQHNVTMLSDRDRDRVLALLDDDHVKPNKALTEAAERYKKHFGRRRT